MATAIVAPQGPEPPQQPPQPQLELASPPPAQIPPAPGADPAPAKPFFGAPTAKVGTGVLAGAITTLIVAMLKGHANWITDAAAVSAMTSLVTFAIQYLVPERPQA